MLIVLVMRMLGEMAAANPSTGSFADYARNALGGWAGFSVGWLYWYFWVIVVGFEAVAGAKILQLWLRRAAVGALAGADAADDGDQPVLGPSLGEFEYWFAGIKVAAIFVFLVLGSLFVLGLWPGRSLDFSNLTAHGGFFPNGAGAIFSGIVVVIFSMVGAEIATIAAAESERPGARRHQGHQLGHRCASRSSSSARSSCSPSSCRGTPSSSGPRPTSARSRRWASRTPPTS